MAHVLVVDDDDSIRGLLRTVLAAEGHMVEEAADGTDALRAIEERRPDLILLDLNMPGMDGWRFLDELYGRGLRDQIRIIIVTAHAELGAPSSISPRRVLAKPFDLDTLATLVELTLCEEPCDIRRQTDRTEALIGLLGRMEQVLG